MSTGNLTPFGFNLARLRRERGMTQAQLAERAGLHLHGLTKLEQGDRQPSWETVQTLAKALGVTCEAFTEPMAAVESARGANRHHEPAKRENLRGARKSGASSTRRRRQPRGSK